ncbi:MAG: hypothetical protein HMLKMBBP_03073 [Planctomycetes bacterium]|nr:hypothetical protein [Planctomycetota bacterium]
MLFSHRELASWLSSSFECAWESVRDVPKVTVDFGGGNVVRRTLHGNVVTWVTDADGRVVEALGGLYEPGAYRARLEQSLLVSAMLSKCPDGAARDAAFADYHARQAERIAAGSAPLVVRKEMDPSLALSKMRIEDPFKYVLSEPGSAYVHAGPPITIRLAEGAPAVFGSKGLAEAPVRQSVAAGTDAPSQSITTLGAAKTLTERSESLLRTPPLDRPRPSGDTIDAPGVRADRGLLAQDTAAGETVHRPAIHALLAKSGRAAYTALSKPLYRDVLHLDLDDPWLGLGGLLFGTYPFEK